MSKIRKFTDISDIDNFLAKRDSSSVAKEVNQVVKSIISDVKKDENEVFNYTKKFDALDLNSENIKFSQGEIDQAYQETDKELINSLEIAYKRVLNYHSKQLPEDFNYEDEYKNQLGWKWYPIENIGIYVPGGKASYPSSVIMSAAIAKVAGNKRVIISMPCPKGKYSKAVLAAAKICGIEDVYKVGGAQAISAMAFGTSYIPKMDKIVGPGNAYVAEAKRQLYGEVGIDSIAGPSEVMIIADNSAKPEYIVADLMAQAEHDSMASSILVTNDQKLAEQVDKLMVEEIELMPRKDITKISWQKNGAIFLVDDLTKDASAIANILAPEHLQLMTNNNPFFIDNITKAGAIFVGDDTSEAIGDYIAGASHVLPTAQTARFSSGLSIYDFLRKSSVTKFSSKGVEVLGPDVVKLAESEGLFSHAKSAKLRLDKKK